MIHYFDSSALGKLAFDEPGTERLRRLFEPLDTPEKATSHVTVLEFRSTLRRRQRAEEIPPADAEELLLFFQGEIERISLQPVNQVVLDLAAQVMDRQPLRSLDAIQLGSCLAVRENSSGKPVVFVCSDRRLLDAAKAEGLEVLNPAE
ncbi:MAG: type II toxin-antitoxin system VapC family toxin [Bryobacteraceae bacterium]|nr:type II toxin-antitoxin system VapC family toxin [Bryobacteraceae bacterium]